MKSKASDRVIYRVQKINENCNEVDNDHNGVWDLSNYILTNLNFIS